VPLPDRPDLEWLRKQAKRRLDALRASNADAQLADAQFALAKEHGFSSWRALKAHVDSLTERGRLFEAARQGDAAALASLLDRDPALLNAREPPYEWTLLHAAAERGQLAIVDLLLARGLDPDTREKGDNTCAMHWAAAAGRLDVVRRLADAGGDVVGRGDDHQLEVIGWATCWDETDDEAHRAVAAFLVSRGARHHIFSAIASGLEEEVRRIVAEDPSALNRRQSRNEDHRLPLHFAVLKNRPAMVALLLELGADPLAVDGGGMPAAAFAPDPDADRAAMRKIRELFSGEQLSAARGSRRARVGMMDVLALLALREWDTADALVRDDPAIVGAAGAANGVLHLMAKRNDLEAVAWLLERGADVNARWDHGGADVTALHLAASRGHVEMARLLLAAGADPAIRDSRHDSDPLGWAEFFQQPRIVALLTGGAASG
jgi:ankyrin repeat protein